MGKSVLPPSWVINGITCILSIILVIPPVVMAQVFPGSGRIGGGPRQGMLKGQNLPIERAPRFSGKPILIDPDALKDISPSFAPCPALISDLSDIETQLQGQAQRNFQEALGKGGFRSPEFPGPNETQNQGYPLEVRRNQPPGKFGGPPANGGGVPILLYGQYWVPLSSSAQINAGSNGNRVGAGSIQKFTPEIAFFQSLVPKSDGKPLEQFGYDFFKIPFPRVPAIMDVPVGPDYVLGPQDTLSVNIWNVPDPRWNQSFVTQVKRDGTIFLPNAGSLSVVGMTFSQVNRAIQARLNKLLKRYEFHIAMARLRTITVYVVGEVVRPGAYEMGSLATVSHALYAGCGLSTKGSLRNIQVVRGGSKHAVDFYQFFLHGDRRQDVRLRSGDTVLVPLIGPFAAISGPVKRPAIYELKGITTLNDMVNLAGGLTPAADRKHVQIFRVVPGEGRIILDVPVVSSHESTKIQNGKSLLHGVSLDGGNNAKSGKSGVLVQDGDFIRIAEIPSQIDNSITLTGAVRNPGLYPFRPGMRLRDLLYPSQMLVEAFWEEGELIRTDPVTYQRSVIPINLFKLFQGQEENNLELQRLDEIVVRSQAKAPRMVAVGGEVKRPGEYAIGGGERLSSVLKRAGGFTEEAYPPGLVLTRDSLLQSQSKELRKFVADQKQMLVTEAANIAAGGGGGQGGALQLILQNLQERTGRLEPGRVVITVETLDQLEGSPGDVLLENGDRIAVPQRPETVTIVGAVRNPVSVLHHDELSVEDYIFRAGGFSSDADEDDVYILQANGSTEAAYMSLREVDPGETIVVPAIIKPKTQILTLWTSIASVLASSATAIASLIVIGNQ